MLRTRLAVMASLVLLCVAGSHNLRAQAPAVAAPEAPRMEFVFEEIVTLGAAVHPGATPYGERNLIPITGGTFSGPKIKGKVLSGGWDWQLTTKAGCFKIQADYMIQADDGAVINVLTA